MRYWIKQVLIAVDQLFNALMGGWADETLSSRAHRLAKSSTFWRHTRNVIDKLFFWDVERYGPIITRYCELAYISEMERMQSPPEMRT